MDKYEYNLKLDQMKSLYAEEKYEEAAEIADSINWNKVKNPSALLRAGEIYEKTGRYQDSRDILLMAYDRSPIGRGIIFRLAMVAVRMKDFQAAQDYYDEFVEIAPHDNSKYILRYDIKKAQGEPYTELIPILEELREQEYTEEWAYELAYLYHKAGMSDKCIEICDELILWFGDGPYVERALELKMLYQPLSKPQEEKYRSFRKTKDSYTHIEVEDLQRAGEFSNQPVAIPQVELGPERFNTVNLQKEIARGMQQIIDATEKSTIADTMDNINRIAEEIPYLMLPKEEEESGEETYIETDEEIDDSLRMNFQELLAEDSDGQISLMMNERAQLERQITGQITIEEVLEEWERTRWAAEAALQEAEQRKLESAKARALQQAGDIMDRLTDVIPKLDAGVTPRQLLEQKYLKGRPETVVRDPIPISSRLAKRRAAEKQREEGWQTPEEFVAGARQETYPQPDGMQQPTEGQELFSEESRMQPAYMPEEAGAEEFTGQELSSEEYMQQPPAESDMTEQPAYMGEESVLQGFMPRTFAPGEPDGYVPEEIGAEDYIPEGFGPKEPAADDYAEENYIPEGYAAEEPSVNGYMPEGYAAEEPSVNDYMPEGYAAEEPSVNGYMPEGYAAEEPSVNGYMPEGYAAEGLSAEACEPEESSAEGCMPEAYMPQESDVVSYMPEDYMPKEPVPEGYMAHEPVPEEYMPEGYMAHEPGVEGYMPHEPVPESYMPHEPVPESYMPQESCGEISGQDILFEGERQGPHIAEASRFEVPVTEIMPEGNSEGDSSYAQPEEKAFFEGTAGEEPVRRPKGMTERWKNRTLRMPQVKEPKDLGDDEPKEEPKVIESLTDEQKKIFSYFIPVKGMEDQLCRALTGITGRLRAGREASTGNLIIQGGQACGKTTLATSMIKVLQEEIGQPNEKIGKIQAEALNKKDIGQLLRKVAGGCLIIEQAGELTRETIVKLSLLLEQDTSGILIILEDTSKGIKKTLAQDEGFARKFTEKITVPIFSNDELVAFARSYSKELGYEIDEMAVLALYNRISNIQRLDQATTLTEVKDIVDEAIKREARGGMKKYFSILTASRYTDDDLIVLREKDFN